MFFSLHVCVKFRACTYCVIAWLKNHRITAINKGENRKKDKTDFKAKMEAYLLLDSVKSGLNGSLGFSS